MTEVLTGFCARRDVGTMALAQQAKAVAVSQPKRKTGSLTGASSSRWAGAITRIRRRLSVPVAERHGRLRGYATKAERYQEQRRFQVLSHRLTVVDQRIQGGRVSVCRAVPCATTSPSIQQRDAGTWTPRGSVRPPPPRSSTSSGHAGSWPSISTPVTWQRRRWTRRGTRSVSRSRFRLLSPDCQPPPVTGTYERRSPHCSRPPEPTAAGQS